MISVIQSMLTELPLADLKKNVRDAHPHPGSISFIFMQFSGKILKLVPVCCKE